MAVAADDAGEIGRSGWRQGSILPDDLLAQLPAGIPPFGLPERTTLIVVSHDCDVTNDSFVKEPQVELLVAGAATPMPLRLQGRDPRRLQLRLEGPAGELVVEASAHARFFVDRQRLLGHSPRSDMRLGAEDTRRLSEWLAKRYARSAFPDEFNRRLAPVLPDVKELFRRHGDAISELFLTTEDAELKDGEPYGVLVWAVMRDDDHRQDPLRAEAQGCLDQLLTLFNACEGIEADGRLRSDADLSLYEIRSAKRWDAWDWLSPVEEA